MLVTEDFFLMMENMPVWRVQAKKALLIKHALRFDYIKKNNTKQSNTKSYTIANNK